MSVRRGGTPAFSGRLLRQIGADLGSLIMGRYGPILHERGPAQENAQGKTLISRRHS